MEKSKQVYVRVDGKEPKIGQPIVMLDSYGDVEVCIRVGVSAADVVAQLRAVADSIESDINHFVNVQAGALDIIGKDPNVATDGDYSHFAFGSGYDIRQLGDPRASEKLHKMLKRMAGEGA